MTPELPPADLDTSSWPTYEEAAQILGVNRRTIQRAVAKKKMQGAMRPRPGLSDVGIVHPEDVMRERNARLAQAKKLNGTSPFVMPQDTDRNNVSDTSSRALSAVSQDMSLFPTPLLQVLEKIALTLATPAQPALPPSKRIPSDRKQLLTMSEAHELGWPVDKLKKLRDRDQPPGIWLGKKGDTKRFRFSRAALAMELEV